MPLELYEDAYGDVRNAQALATASEVAYFPEPEGARAFQERLGMEARLISVGNTQAYLAQNEDNLVVAFRGTESPTGIEGLKDWLLTNAVNLLTVPEGRLGTDFAAAGVGARFHQGFLGAIADIWPPVSEAVETAQNDMERCFWLTGHSLGGALALLAGWLFERKMIPPHQIYTYGGPMVGNALAVQAVNEALKDRIYRYIDCIDPVPQLPTISLVSNEYCHCDKEMDLGAVEEESTQAANKQFQEMATEQQGEQVDPPLMERIWGSVRERLGSHSMTNYIKRLTRN